MRGGRPERSRPKDRGAIDGDLAPLKPFLHVGYGGVGHWSQQTPISGEFLLGSRSGQGYAWYGGFLVPLVSVEDPTLRRLVQEGASPGRISERFASLFGVSLSSGEAGWQIGSDRNFYRRLHGTASYVTEIEDSERVWESGRSGRTDSYGSGSLIFSPDAGERSSEVRVLQTKPWPWTSYGELAEVLFYGRPGLSEWPLIRSFLVFGETASLPDWMLHEDRLRRLTQPSDRLSGMFEIAGNAPTEVPRFRFHMREHGWANLEITLGGKAHWISLSDAFSPWENLAAWGQAIRRGKLPIEVTIDEEGSYVHLAVYPTRDPERVALFVEDGEGKVLLQSAPSSSKLVADFRT